MSNLRITIESLATHFASSILDALRSASIDELADISSPTAGAPRRGRPPASHVAAPQRAEADSSASASTGSARRRGRGGRLGRRSAGDITQMVESIVELLAKSGTGLRAEQIRETLGVEAKELPRPLAEALSSGRVTKNGQKRATTYFAGGSAGAPKRRGRPAGRRNNKKA